MSTITIIQTANHFLYLPIHYAKHKDWFGYISGDVDIEIVSSTPATDRGAYMALKRGRQAGVSENIFFAVADPAELIHDSNDDTTNRIVILAELITNLSFWAVDHNTHNVRCVNDLAQFDKIIAYNEGTTSHYIAEKICRSTNKKPKIITVDQGSELTTLRSVCNETAVALTPNLLALSDLLENDIRNEFHVDLALGKTQEYANVLVTALMSRQSIVDSNKELVLGIIAAIQRSMLLVRFNDPDVIEFSKEHYNASEGRILDALRRASDAQIFPGTIEVSEEHLKNCVTSSSIMRDISLDEHYIKNKLDTCVRQYISTPREAISKYILPIFNMKNNKKTTKGLLQSILYILSILLQFISNLLPLILNLLPFIPKSNNSVTNNINIAKEIKIKK